MSIPRNHHFVPQCYLREFKSQKKLFCLDLSLVINGVNVKPSQKEPGQVCYIADYYKIRNDHLFELKNYDEYFIELKSFKKLENEYRLVARKLIVENELNFHQATSLCDFILNLKIRNPSFNKFIEHHKERNTEVAKKSLVAKLMNDYRFRAYSYSFLKMQVDSFGEKILKSENFNKSLQLKQIVDKTDFNSDGIEKFRKEILDCRWFVLDSAGSDFSFITSDNPGISVTTEGVLENLKFKGGFKFYLPINGRFCFCFSDEDKDFYYSSNEDLPKEILIKYPTNEEIQLINFQQIAYFNRYIFSCDEESLQYIKEELLAK